MTTPAIHFVRYTSGNAFLAVNGEVIFSGEHDVLADPDPFTIEVAAENLARALNTTFLRLVDVVPPEAEEWTFEDEATACTAAALS